MAVDGWSDRLAPVRTRYRIARASQGNNVKCGSAIATLRSAHSTGKRVERQIKSIQRHMDVNCEASPQLQNIRFNWKPLVTRRKIRTCISCLSKRFVVTFQSFRSIPAPAESLLPHPLHMIACLIRTFTRDEEHENVSEHKQTPAQNVWTLWLFCVSILYELPH